MVHVVSSMCKGMVSYRKEVMKFLILLSMSHVFLPSRKTVLVRLSTEVKEQELSYLPGDHLKIFPANEKRLVDAILAKVNNGPPADQVIEVEVAAGGIGGNIPFGKFLKEKPGRSTS
jgi:sulfite reductase alpha subunit-like flavoprotein